MVPDTQLPLNALELLSPARDADTGIAAIDHGADAVYIGGPAFGARQAAGNSLDDIHRLCEYAHRYHARVFMALNTLFTDEELPKARSLAFDAAKAGIDVLIVQDMGLMAGPLPDIELHASTQCDIRTPEKARFLEEAGFSQMVLARELSLAEVTACRAALRRARIEYFIHGALCVSYSGQCYMSEALVRRSANRGACAQLCRLPYDVFTEAGERIARRSHVLSLRDNNQTDNLEALIDAGVSSFKIEGRLKDIVYVKNITAWYRRKLDEIIARRPEFMRSSDGVTTAAFEPDPEKSFQRGRTDYFIRGREFDKPYELAQLESPKNTGIPAARAERVEPGVVTVRPAPGITIVNGDGLTYLGADEEVHGLAVNRAAPDARGLMKLFLRNPSQMPPELKKGMTLMRNRDQAFTKALSGPSAERRIPVTVTFMVEDDALSVIMTDGTYCGEASVAMALDVPSNPEKNRATLLANLSKLGDTPFSAEEIFVPDPLDVFVPASTANMLRREAAAELAAAREAGRVRPRRAPVSDDYPYPEAVLGFNANVANREARAFYARHGARVTQPAFEIKPVAGASLMTCRHCIRAALKRCPKMLKAFPEILETTPREALRPEPLILVNSAGERFRAEFHCRHAPCEMTIAKI
ncbi:MAG: U32 family peptidase [Sutterella sp.]|nr:U32 family peptidase [Sutterella sp.]